MTREQFKKDIVELSLLWKTYRLYQYEFISSNDANIAYANYWNRLESLSKKYNCSLKSLADCIRI